MPHLSPHFVDPIFLFLAELSWVNLRFALGNDLRWARARLLSLIALQPGHPHRGSEFVSALFCDSFLLDSSSCKWQWRNWNGVHSNFWSAHCPLAVCQPPHHSNHTAVGLVVPSALRFQSSAFASPEHTLRSSNEALCNVVSHSKPNTHFVTGIHSVLGLLRFTLPKRSHQAGRALVTNYLPCHLSGGILPSRPFWHLDNICYLCVFHQPRQDCRVFSEFLLRAAFNVAFGCSDEATQQHHCVVDEPVGWLVSWTQGSPMWSPDLQANRWISPISQLSMVLRHLSSMRHCSWRSTALVGRQLVSNISSYLTGVSPGWSVWPGQSQFRSSSCQPIASGQISGSFVWWFNVSFVLGAIHHFVIVWGCICVMSVCMFCVCFCRDVVVVLLSLRVARVWVSFSQSQHHEKNKKTTWKQQSQQKILQTEITKQEITKT